MRNIPINMNPYDNTKLYKKDNIDIKPGLSVLVGANGTGKSSMLYQIKKHLSNLDIDYTIYDAYNNDHSTAKSNALASSNLGFLSLLLASSEGEQVYYNFGEFCEKAGKFMRDHDKREESWILIDALDSGLSIDMIDEIKSFINEIILRSTNKNNIYVIMTSNNYEMCHNENCIDVHNCEYITFDTYDSFRKFIFKSRKIKNNRKNHKK